MIDEISLNGDAKIKFNEKVLLLRVEDIIKYDLIEVKILWNNPEYQEIEAVPPEFTWKVANMTDDILQLKLNFTEPLKISQGKSPDVLVVTFKKRNYFLRRSDFEALNWNSTVLMADIPRQTPNERETKKIEDTLTQFEAVSGTTLFIFAGFVLMNLPKSFFWSLHATI